MSRESYALPSNLAFREPGITCDGEIVLTVISHDMVTWIVSDWHVRIQNCYIIKPQKSLEEYQTPIPSQRVGSGKGTIIMTVHFEDERAERERKTGWK